MNDYDAIIIGSGPNGLAAAISLAREGWRVAVFEAKGTVGGGMRSAEITLPGFTHDICSAIHPLGKASPFFQTLPLEQHGIEWIHPDLPLAHPMDDGSAAVLHRSIEETAATLGKDARRYVQIMRPLVNRWDAIIHELLGPARLPKSLGALIRAGAVAAWPADLFARTVFDTETARGFYAGLAAHAIMPLSWLATSAFGMMLGLLGHAVGWPVPKGGSQSIADAMVRCLESMGGEVFVNLPIRSLDDLPSAKAYLFDLTPRQLIEICGKRMPNGYRRRLERFRYGMGVFKIDYALSEPIPWVSAECRRAGTLHLGATLEEIAQSEHEIWHNKHPKRPYVLVAQQSLFDDTRAPAGKHTGWAYCHVPRGSTVDMTDAIEDQIE